MLGADCYVGRGLVKKSMHDWDGAIADFDKDIELKPDDSQTYGERAFTKKSKGDVDGAFAD